MPTGMRIQTALLQGLLGCTVGVLAAAFAAGDADAQALLVEPLPGGTELVLVNQPLADATTLVWPEIIDGESAIGRLTSGRLTLAAEVETVFARAESAATAAPAPSVIVAVGGVSAAELSALLGRVLGDRSPVQVAHPTVAALVEGGLDRRLGAPGTDAMLRFEILLPPMGDRRRSSMEVLWDLVPQLLADLVPGLQSRIDGPLGILDGRVDAEFAEQTVGELRLELARFAADPRLQTDDVNEARRRLEVRRYAMLDEHPEAAERVLESWLVGGENAVRELVFGIQSVTLASVRDVAASWLPLHPGRAQLILPPRVFNPRFAAGPQVQRLANDLTAAVLQRTGTPLAVVCLRPVMVPDLDGEVTATVLARLARELRSARDRPGFVHVRTAPPLIEVAGPADGFGELMEQLVRAYLAVISDHTPVAGIGDEAHRRALDLMAGLLGVTETEDLSPAALLRPGNLALGVVATDAEAAAEALSKFWMVESANRGSAHVQRLPAVPRTRVAAPGDTSVLVVALEMAFGANEAVSMVVDELLTNRAHELWPESHVDILHPYVPGREMLLLEVASDGSVDQVEESLVQGWPGLVAATDEEELASIKRRVAASASAEMSGVAGHARRCAAVAAGASRWHQPAEFELEILTVGPEIINTALQGLSDFASLEAAGAGVLPISDLRGR